MAGRAVVGNQKYGIFPLKGKLLNVRGASPKELLGNEEIINLKKILGLKHGVRYVSSGKEAKDAKEEDNNSKVCDVSELRYAGIVTLCDQDSVTGDTPLLVKKNNILDIVKIEDLTNNWQISQINNKNYGLSDYQIWTDKGWTNIVKVIKHKVNKKIYRVLTHTGVVDVTEDHSLLNENDTSISSKPKLHIVINKSNFLESLGIRFNNDNNNEEQGDGNFEDDDETGRRSYVERKENK
jgi:hypothetical protein